jgi:hypothetical protein
MISMGATKKTALTRARPEFREESPSGDEKGKTLLATKYLCFLRKGQAA